MPSPLPIRRQLLRSSGLPCKSRGYHARGAEMVRPSLRSIMRASSVTVTCCAVAIRISIAKEFIPPPQKAFSVFLYEPLYPIDFSSAETPAVLKPDRIKPEFGLILVALNVNVRRLITVTRIKEESVRTTDQDSWHDSPLLLCFTNEIVSQPKSKSKRSVRVSVCLQV
jgi:hypothetical protein